MTRARSTPLWIAPLLALAAACSTAPDPAPVDDEFTTASEKVLWQSLRIALDRADFPVGAGAEPGKRRIESGWKVELAPFKGAGFRERATVTYEPLEEDRWNVSVRVERETNESLRSTDLRYADWQPAADDEAAARRILQFARSLLGGGDFEVGDPQPPR